MNAFLVLLSSPCRGGEKKEAQEYYELGVTYGADEKWIMPMLNTEEAYRRLLEHLSEFMN